MSAPPPDRSGARSARGGAADAAGAPPASAADAERPPAVAAGRAPADAADADRPTAGADGGMRAGRADAKRPPDAAQAVPPAGGVDAARPQEAADGVPREGGAHAGGDPAAAAGGTHAGAADAASRAPGPVPASWQGLRRFTAARIALGRAGVAVPTAAELAFRLAHARARDAVHLPFDAEAVAAALRADGRETITLASAAADRHIYLQRPDLGRRLDEPSRERLASWRRAHGGADCDLALVIADGLSALAVHRHAAPLVAALRPHLPADAWTLAPVVLVHQGRVAIGDEIGEALGARCVAVLIGERPGLSSPDSLGLYISWAPRVGLTDAARNCISNVRPEGLTVEAAAAKLAWLLGEARRRGLTGVALKDEVDEGRPRLGAETHENFLIDDPGSGEGTGDGPGSAGP